MSGNLIKNSLDDIQHEKIEKLRNLFNEKKAIDTVFIDLKKINTYFEIFVITTGSSRLHCRALCNESIRLMNDLGEKPYNKPDLESEWMILDYNDIIVHIFTQEKREYYSLEKLWGDGVFF